MKEITFEQKLSIQRARLRAAENVLEISFSYGALWAKVDAMNCINELNRNFYSK